MPMATDRGDCGTRLLTDLPADNDAFGAHERVARAIADVVRAEDGGRTIGLEGGWGAGKSTVVKLLEQQLAGDADSATWIFDAWAHEGDPLRRSFLEGLSQALGARGWVDAERWAEKREELANRRRVEETETSPNLTRFGKLLSLSGLLVPLGIALVAANAGLAYLAMGVLFSVAPLLLVVVAWAACRLDWTRVQELLAIAGNAQDDAKACAWAVLVQSAVTRHRTTTVQTPDPTSVEFGQTFAALMGEALPNKKPKRRFVIVVDNLDRVAPADALSIWSTLQTFLQPSEHSPPSWLPRLWVLIPYDRTGIRRLWQPLAQEELSADHTSKSPPASGREDLAEFFLDKRLQIRFEVPPPVLSDWHNYLLQLLGQALPSHDRAEFHAAYRLYASRMDREGTAPTPRDLKLYVNGIASVHRQRQDEFPLAHLGYYYLLQRDGTDIPKGLREGNLPMPDVRGILGADVADHLAALLFSVDVELARQLLLRDPIQSALRTASGDDLRVLSQSRGFWEVLEQVLPPWLGEQPAEDVLNAARCLDRSGLLAGDDARAEPAVVRSAMSTAAMNIGQWPAFDEATADGVAAAIRLDPDTALARSLWAAASATPVEADQARAWVTAVLVPMIEADQRGLTESYATGMVIPTDAAGFQQACAELMSADPTAQFWAAFRVRPNVDIMETLTAAISAEPAEELGATVRVLRATGIDFAWNELGDATINRLSNVNLVGLGPLIECMWQLQSVSEHIQGHLEDRARQGFWLHSAQRTWDRGDLDTAAWCFFLFLRFRPDAVLESHVGESQAGLRRLTAIFESPQDHEPFVSAFVKRITAIAEPRVLLSVLDQAPQSRPFIHACFRQIATEPSFAEQVTPALLVASWQPLMAALQEDSPDTFDELVARVDARASLSEYVMEAPFTPSRDGLYAALLRRAGAENDAFREWYVAGVESLDTNAWRQQFDAPGHVIQTLIDLRHRGLPVNVGRPFVDALIARAKDAVTGQFTSEHFGTAWQDVLALLPPDYLLLLVRNLYQALQNADGDISETFFAMYGPALSKHPGVLSGGNAFMLFDHMLIARNEPGLEWTADFLETTPTFHESCNTPDTVAAFKDHLRDYITGETGDQPIDNAVRGICVVLGVALGEEGSGKEAASEMPSE